MSYIRQKLGHEFILKPASKNTKPMRKKLTQTIKKANRDLPYYKGSFKTFLANTNKADDKTFWQEFEKLPILTKFDVRANNDRFLSKRVAKKVDLMANGQPPGLKKALWNIMLKRNFYTSLSTGGTSGKPAHRWLDYPDMNMMAQSFLESFKRNGWKPGESFVVFYPTKSYFTDVYAKYSSLLNTLLGFNMIAFTEINKDVVLNLLRTLRHRKATLLVVFPCVLQRIAEIMLRENMKPFQGLKYINVSGEFFLDCSKNFIQEMFPGADIQSTYGAVEFGEIAHQKNASSSFNLDVFSDFAYIENGEDDTLLVTTLTQDAFPLIRYRIEDKAEVITNKSGKQSILKMEGKNTDYLTGAEGQKVYASFFNTLINDLNEITGDQILHFMLRHEQGEMNLNFILRDPANFSQQTRIKKSVLHLFSFIFSNYETITVEFPDSFNHDYTRKFKIIGEGDGLAEYVGGYIKRKAG